MMKKNKNILITLSVILIIIVLNVYVRSIKVITVNTNNSEEIISVENKYYDYFKLLNIFSVLSFIILFSVNIIILKAEKKQLNQRLSMITSLFSNVGFNKIEVADSILTEHDLVIIDAWNKSINEIIHLTNKREQYFSFMVHDLKKPVHILQADLELYDSQDDIMELITKLNEELSYLEYEITKYLHIEKISFFEKANLKERNITKLLTKYADEYKKLGLDIKIIDELNEKTILTDEVMLDKIVANLCQNAYKYSSNMQLNIILRDGELKFVNESTNKILTQDIFDMGSRQFSDSGNGLGSQIICKYIQLLNWEISSSFINETFEVKIKLIKEKNEI